VPPATSDVESIGTIAPPSSIVMLGQDTSVTDAQTYSSRGLLPDSAPPLSLEKELQDKVTSTMMGNFSSSSVAGRFQGLGAALLAQLAEGGSDFSQSILSSSTGKKANAAELAAQQSNLHTKADNSITLTVQTASGRTILLNLSSQENGLAVQYQVTGGTLDDAELGAVATLANAFQSAIDGFTAEPPKLDLSKLAQFDPSVLSSVDLNAHLKLSDDSIQTLDFHADSQTRTVSMSGPSGNLRLSVDMKNSAILGDAGQQAQALQSYLSQFDSARRRGDGNPELMTLFKDAFSAMNSNYGQDLKPNSLITANSISLTDVDHGMLTGLADFTASVTQNVQAINPMRPNELDQFSYQVSQATSTKGENQLNRSIEQNQQSHLSASYHQKLYPGVALALGTSADSQNYYYNEIDDTASSLTNISYVKGLLANATSTQTATQSTHTLKYVMGHLEDDTTTPRTSTKTQNFMGLVESALRNDKQTPPSVRNSRLQQVLSTVHNNIILQSNPEKLSGSAYKTTV